MKIMELNRTNDREQRQRLSQPNTTGPAEVLATKPKKRKRKKRPRGDKPPAAAAGRDVLFYSSSDDDNVGGGKEEEEEEEAKGGFDAGLASYKKLLSSLEAGGSGEDKDLAAAVVARRMQREGRDDSYGSSSSSGSDSGEGEEDGNEEEEVDDDDSDDSGQEGEGVDGEGNDNAKEHGDNGEENLNGGTPNGRSTHDVDVESDIGGDSSDDDAGARGGGGRAAGRSRDEFCRHFVSTSVFPPEKAAELSSNRGRPSFKPLSSSAARSKWDAAGLSAVASHKAAKQEEKDGDGVVPPPLPKGASVSAELGVLPSLERGWEACNDGAPASKLQSLLLPSLTAYRDMLYCGWRDEEGEEIRRCYALHALNHALTSRRRVARHTARLRKAAEEARVAEALARAAKKEASSGAGDDAEQDNNGGGTGGQDQSQEKRGGGKGSGTPAVGNKSESSIGNGAASGGAAAAAVSSKKGTVDSESDDWQRDQGFTRPKVLILLPFRGLAHEVVEMMIELLGPKTVTVNKGRFDEEYGPDDHDDGEGGIEGAEADGTKRGNARAERAKTVLERKPGDWKALLGDGRNVDDMFTLGISLSPGGGKGKPGEGRGVGVRLYCDFYNSDIIVASPVALHRSSVPGDGGEGDGSGGVDSDFLSSVEVCILDRADVFLMQNWSYVPDIAEVLNSRPTGERASRADFSRVRPLFLHEQGRLFRQTLVFSAFQVGFAFAGLRWRGSVLLLDSLVGLNIVFFVYVSVLLVLLACGRVWRRDVIRPCLGPPAKCSGGYSFPWCDAFHPAGERFEPTHCLVSLVTKPLRFLLRPSELASWRFHRQVPRPKPCWSDLESCCLVCRLNGQDPNLNAFASRHLRNHDGVVKVSRPSGDGHICEVALQAKQVTLRAKPHQPTACCSYYPMTECATYPIQQPA